MLNELQVVRAQTGQLVTPTLVDDSAPAKDEEALRAAVRQADHLQLQLDNITRDRDAEKVRVAALEARLEAKLDSINQRMTSTDHRLDRHSQRSQDLKDTIDSHSAMLNQMQQDWTTTEDLMNAHIQDPLLHPAPAPPTPVGGDVHKEGGDRSTAPRRTSPGAASAAASQNT